MKEEDIKRTLNKVFNSKLVSQKFPEIEEVEVRHIFPFDVNGIKNYELIMNVVIKPEHEWNIQKRYKLHNLIESLLKSVGHFGENTKIFMGIEKK